MDTKGNTTQESAPVIDEISIKISGMIGKLEFTNESFTMFNKESFNDYTREDWKKVFAGFTAPLDPVVTIGETVLKLGGYETYAESLSAKWVFGDKTIERAWQYQKSVESDIETEKAKRASAERAAQKSGKTFDPSGSDKKLDALNIRLEYCKAHGGKVPTDQLPLDHAEALIEAVYMVKPDWKPTRGSGSGSDDTKAVLKSKLESQTALIDLKNHVIELYSALRVAWKAKKAEDIAKLESEIETAEAEVAKLESA